jgi:hypothetical protein
MLREFDEENAMNRCPCSLKIASVAVAMLCLALRPIGAQDRPADEPNPPWKAELSKLPTPRTADDKPNLNGIWMRARHAAEVRLGPNRVPGDDSTTQDEKGNITYGVIARGGGPGAETYINFERDAGVRLRTEPNKPVYKPEYWDRVQDLDERGNFEDPAFTCYPYGLPRMGAPDKIVQSPTEIIFLYRARNEFRVIPTDGRPLPPIEEWEGISWYGKSVGRWDGDTLVIESVDFTDQSWLGWAGYFHSNDMKVTERIRREGNTLVWQATVEDPQVLMQPWVMNPWTLRLNPDPKAMLQEDLPCRDYDQRHMQTNERG